MNNTRIALVVIFLAAAGLAGCRPAKGPAAPAATPAQPLAIRVQAVAIRTFERRLTVQGTLEARHTATVGARIEGTLDRIWVDEGDPVRAGETPLFQIDPVSRSNAVIFAVQALAVAEAGHAVSQANAERTQAEARKAFLDFERYARLHQEGKVSDNEYETHQIVNAQTEAGVKVSAAQVDLAGRQVRQAEASLAIARKNLEDARVLAPISGVVSARTAEPGEHMAVGRAVLRIVDLASVEAAAFLPAQFHADVIPGQTPFRLSVNGCPAGEHRVTYRSPTIDPVLRTFEIKGLVAGGDAAAVPGSMADLALVFETHSGLGVPSAAILSRAGQSVVFVVRDGRAVQVGVATGLQTDAWTEIRAGLEAGEQVVVEGQTQLQDGRAVDVF